MNLIWEPLNVRINWVRYFTQLSCCFEKETYICCIEDQMKVIAELIDKAIRNFENEEELAVIKNEVKELCSKFPLYPELN